MRKKGKEAPEIIAHIVPYNINSLSLSSANLKMDRNEGYYSFSFKGI